MSTMGFSNDGQKLFPEEAVFLCDCDEIELITGDEVILSKIQAFGLLETCDIDMKAYTVYAALREQRFHVYRHGAWKIGREIKSLPQPRVITVLESMMDNRDPLSNKRQKPDDSSTEQSTVNDQAEPPRKMAAEEGQASPDEVLSISFDVYKPQSGFSKNKMEKPDFSLMILSADGRMPSVRSLRNAIRRCDPGVPLRMAIVGDSSLTFVEVADFDPGSDIDDQIDLK